jgi:hypothetical protein
MGVPMIVAPFAISSPLPDSKISNNPLENCIEADRKSPWLFRSNQNSPRPSELSESILPLLNQRFFLAPTHLLSSSLLPSSFQTPCFINPLKSMSSFQIIFFSYSDRLSSLFLGEL